MPVGYLPDMFGHIAQMPQILSLAGFGDAVVWRGVPSQVTTNAFAWEAPDGSVVRAEYLPVGYGNGSSLPEDAKALIRRTRDNVREMADFVPGDLLLMNGSDHLAPQPWLGRVIAEANALQDEFVFEVTSLAGYLSGRSTDGLTRVQGELRSGHRANMLMGVTSNRVDVKRLGAVAERELERRAEPLAALFLAPDEYPQRLFDLAWREMVRNSAHDSVCACSVDDVVDAVLHRYTEARDIAAGLAERSVTAFRRSLAQDGPFILNPVARCRAGVVEVVVAADGPASPDVQVVSERHGLPGTMVLDANTVRTVLGMLQGPRISDDAWVHDVRVDDTAEGIDITVTVGTEERPGVPIARAKQDIYTRLGAQPDAVVRVAMDQPSTRRILARVPEVAGYGWLAFEPAPLDHRVEVTEHDDVIVVSNGLVVVEIDRESGTFALDGTPGYGRLVDGGDLGDSYNYSPPRQDAVVEAPGLVEARVDEQGPVRARVHVRSEYTWPDHVDGTSQARVGEQHVTVDTDIELRADERVVRVTTTFVNPSGDHRLRTHLPIPEASTSLGGRECLCRGDPRSDRGGQARRVRAADGARSAVRPGRPAHRGPRRRMRIRTGGRRRRRRHTPWRSPSSAPPGCCRGSAWPTDRFPRARSPRWRVADARCPHHADLRPDARLRGSLPAGGRRPAPTRNGVQPRRRHPAFLGERAQHRGRRGLGVAPCRRSARGARCSTRRRSRRWSHSPDAPAGSSTYAAIHWNPSKAPSS